MEGQQYVQLPPGTTECNHSYYTRNPFSASHSAQQLQNDTPATPAQPPASVQEVDAPASSGVISSSLLSCSAFGSQVTVDPTRYGTGGDMPLADVITQLSFLEFLQRCGASIALPQPSRPSASISLRDVTVQTTPPCHVSHQVSTQTSVQQDMLSCDEAVQTSSLDAAVQTTPQSTPSQHVSTQICSRSASSFSVDIFVQTPIRSAVLHDVATQLPITEFFTGCIFSNDPLDRQNLVRQSPPPMQGSQEKTSATAWTRTARPAFWSRYWVSLAHYTWRIYYSCTSTSSATFSYCSCASTDPCLYHPCGITASTFSHYRQEKCQYRLGGNAQSC